MKTVLRILFAALAGLTLIICTTGCSNGPEKVVRNAISCLQKEDARGYVESYYIPESDVEEFIELCKKSVFPGIEEKKGIARYRITGSEIDKEANEASVNVHFYYGDGTDEETPVKLVLVDGKWYLDLDK